MNKSIDIKKLYFDIYGAFADSRKESLVLFVPVGSESDAFIFFPRSLNEITDYIFDKKDKFYKNKFIMYISIANDDDIAFIKSKFPNCIKIVVPKSIYHNLTNKEMVYHSNEFEKGYESTSPIRQYLSLLETNNVFNCFVEEKGKKRIGVAKTIRTYLDEDLLTIDGDRIVFSKTGLILFANDSKYNRKINIRITHRSNNVDYVLENIIDCPLYASLDIAAKYIYEKLPTIQTRKSLLSESGKQFTIDEIRKILMLIFETNDYDSLSQINITINSTILSVSFFETNNNKTIRRFYKKYFGMESKQSLFSYFVNNGKDVVERKRNGVRIIDFYPFNGINLFDKNLDEIDYSIVSFAKNVDNFRRVDIDKKFSISSRNSNSRLNRLTELGILKQSGIGKSTTYKFVKQID